MIRLHHLSTHATLLLADGVPVEAVSERLGHASATMTLTVHQRVHPGMGRGAAPRCSRVDSAREVSRGITRASRATSCERPGLLTYRNTGAG